MRVSKVPRAKSSHYLFSLDPTNPSIYKNDLSTPLYPLNVSKTRSSTTSRNCIKRDDIYDIAVSEPVLVHGSGRFRTTPLAGNLEGCTLERARFGSRLAATE